MARPLTKIEKKAYPSTLIGGLTHKLDIFRDEMYPLEKEMGLMNDNLTTDKNYGNSVFDVLQRQIDIYATRLSLMAKKANVRVKERDIEGRFTESKSGRFSKKVAVLHDILAQIQEKYTAKSTIVPKDEIKDPVPEIQPEEPEPVAGEPTE